MVIPVLLFLGLDAIHGPGPVRSHAAERARRAIAEAEVVDLRPAVGGEGRSG